MKKFDPKKLKELRGEKTLDDMVFELRLKGVRINHSSLSKWENGRVTPNANIIGEIATAFEKEVDFFYSEDNQINQSIPVSQN